MPGKWRDKVFMISRSSQYSKIILSHLKLDSNFLTGDTGAQCVRSLTHNILWIIFMNI